VAAGLLPVIAFFAAPRLDGTVAFFAVVDFTLLAKTFLGAGAVFFAAGAAAFLVGAGLMAVLEGGLEFSFEPDVNGFAFGASLTLPDGPLGSTKIPFSVPLVMARFS